MPLPPRAYFAVAAGTAVNLCLGILYAWSVWKSALTGGPADGPMAFPNDGWHYLSKPDATTPYALCGFLFALFMIPGGRVQDKFGPRVGATVGGLFLAAGCVVAGLTRSYWGLVLGFGVLGGIGMGFGYAASTPAAVKWFGPRRRGLIVGLIVAGYGGAAIYIAPLAKYLIGDFGLSGSFLILGAAFAVVVILAGQLLRPPPVGYVPPAAAVSTVNAARRDFSAGEVLRSWRYYLLVFLFFGSAQSGLLVIGNATPILGDTAKGNEFFRENAWILAAFGGVVNALGRIGTGVYSDRLGRRNAFALNAAVAVACLLLTPVVMAEKNVPLLFLVVGVAFWQYGGGLALMPAWTADLFGPKNMGMNYGLVFLGWGFAFLVPYVAAELEKQSGNLDAAFYMSAGLLATAGVLSRILTVPKN